MAIQGGCLCGKVRYQINGALSQSTHCHCSQCRRAHGAAFATYADCQPEDFSWLAGEELVKVYETGGAIGWVFCSECGATLAATDKGVVNAVTLGTVDGDPGVRPESHIFVGSKAIWDSIEDELPQYDEWPPEHWSLGSAAADHEDNV